MFAGQTNQLPYIRNYAEAHKYFTGRAKPPRSKKWDEHQRPLKDSRSYHYRIETDIRNPGEYYDLVLYSTIMARYHHPDAEGNERRQYMGWNTQTSWGFLANVAGVYWSKQHTTTDGRKVLAPVYARSMQGEDFSLDAWFTPSGALMVERSRHTPHYRKVSTKDDKAARAQAKQLFEPLLTLAALRIPEYAASINFDSRLAGSFRGAAVGYKQEKHLPRLYEALLAEQMPTTEQVDALMTLGQHVFDKIASDRANRAGILPNWHTRRPDPEYADIDPIDERTFTAALWNKLQKTLQLTSTNGYSEYPQFPTLDEIVHSNITTYLPSAATIINK